MNKIVIACDSFKGCLSSVDVAEACALGVASAAPGCHVVKVPVGDGGEGTADALIAAMKGHRVTCRASDPLMRPIEARYGVSADGKTALIEMAEASGLPLLSENERNPLLTTAFGTGQMIMHAIAGGCRKVVIGIGGSATNDGGTGMLQALGVRFYDAQGQPLGHNGAMLENICFIDTSGVPEEVRYTEFAVACDVTAPFYGPDGAAYMFARQKGADEAMTERLDAGLRNFATVIARSGLRAVDNVPGAGAAGGLGGAFLSFLNARLRPGAGLVLDTIGFDRLLDGADLVITGEGQLDRQTCMGKAPYGVMQRARRRGIPVMAIGGAVEDASALNRAGFTAVLCVQQTTACLSEAMRPDTARANIATTVEQAIRLSCRLSHRQ